MNLVFKKNLGTLNTESPGAVKHTCKQGRKSAKTLNRASDASLDKQSAFKMLRLLRYQHMHFLLFVFLLSF